MRPTTALRQMLQGDRIVVAPGAYDALSARLIERAGFPAVYMTGYGLSASVLGQMDIGLLTMCEMLGRGRALASAVRIPVIADADAGYGNYQNVMRTVREYEKAGVAGIHLEDQVTPKRHAGIGGEVIAPLEEMLVRIRAALEARTDPDFVIIGRTDCLPSKGLDEAIRRGQAMAGAGADVIFVELMAAREEMEEVARSIRAPLLINQVEHAGMPLIPADELQAMGYKIVILPLSALFAASRAVEQVLEELWRSGTTASQLGQMMNPGEVEEVLGRQEFKMLEARYGRRGGRRGAS